MHIHLILHKDQASGPVEFKVRRMVNAGFTGRDREEVKHHLEELSAKGVTVPDETPVMYPVLPKALSTDTEIQVYGTETSPEIEYVLLVDDEKRIYVGIGSDHTDRNLELHDIPRAKQICPNLMSPYVWDLTDVKDHWDDLVMKCTVQKEGEQLLYQEGRLGLLMAPDELTELVSERVKGDIGGTVMYSGTVKMETDGFVYADRCTCELVDPKLGRSLEFSYNVVPMNDMK